MPQRTTEKVLSLSSLVTLLMAELKCYSEAVEGGVSSSPDPQHQHCPGVCCECWPPGPTPYLLSQKLWGGAWPQVPTSALLDSDPVWEPRSNTIIPKHPWKLEERKHKRAGREQIQRTERLNKTLKSWIWIEKIKVNSGGASTFKFLALPPEKAQQQLEAQAHRLGSPNTISH